MILRKPYIYLLGVLVTSLVTMSCTKKTIDPPVEGSSPVFSVSGSFAGDDVLIEAGKNDAYMTTFTNSSNGVELFSGRLGTSDLYLEMGIYNGNVDIVQPLSVENFQGSLMVASQCSSPLLVLSKNDFPNSQMVNEVKWFIDGDFVGLNTAEIVSPGRYNVCAEVKFMDQSVASLCNELIVGYNVNAHCKMHYFINAQGHLKAWIDAPSVGIENVYWKVDGVATAMIEFLDTYVNLGSHTVEAEVHFKNGVVRKKSMVIDGSNQGKMIYDFSVLEQNVIDPTKWDYSIVLNIRKDGKLYSTLNTNNSDSQISITDISYYGQNAQGKHVYKCVGQINAMLSESGSAEVKHLQCSTRFALELP